MGSTVWLATTYIHEHMTQESTSNIRVASTCNKHCSKNSTLSNNTSTQKHYRMNCPLVCLPSNVLCPKGKGPKQTTVI